MPTKLSVFCDKVIEAGLLILIVLTPLFLNPFSNTVFEPDKIAMVRGITLILAAAWLIKAVEEESLWKGRDALGRFLRFPLVIPTLLFVGVILLATATSVAPVLSLWGSYIRGEGTYTILCYAALFFLGLGALRRPHQIERLVTAILLASMPVSLYAIMQRVGLDPIPWAGLAARVTYRAVSTQGNPIFLGAYLIMVIPLTVVRLVDSFSNSTTKAASPFAIQVSYAFLLELQIIALVLGQSRGPLLGLLAGMACFFLFWAAAGGRRKWTLAVIGVAAGLLLLIILLNVPGGPLTPLRELSSLKRLSQMLNPQAEGTRERILGWEAVSRLVTADPGRAIIGYGPETLESVLYPYYPKELIPLFAMLGKGLMDRAHNHVFDILTGAGVIGLAAYLLLMGSLLYYGLKWLGLLRERRHRILWSPSLGLGALLGLLLPLCLDRSLKFAGVGIALGMVAALSVFLVLSAFRHEGRKKEKEAELGGTTCLTLIALFAALVAHFIEEQFGIATASTNILFWLFAAMGAALGVRPPEREAVRLPEDREVSPAGQRRKPARRRTRRRRTEPLSRGKILRLENIPVVVYSLLSGLMLMAFVYAFVGSRADLSRHHSSGIWFLLFTWVLLGMLGATVSGMGASSQEPPSSPFRLSLLLSGGCSLLFWVFYQPAVQSPGQGTQGITVISLWVFFLLLTLGAVLTREVGGPMLAWRKERWWAYALLFVVIMGFAISTNLSMLIADAHCRQGVLLAQEKQWEPAISQYEKAVSTAPHQARYHLLLGNAYLEQWRDASHKQGVWLQKGREALERAAGISPLVPDSLARLGSAYLLSAETMADPSERAGYLRQASGYYQEAASLSPWPADVYREWGRAYYDLGQYEEAIKRYQQALEFDEEGAETYLALGDVYEAQGEFDRAIEAYKGAVAVDPDWAEAYIHLGWEYSLKGELEKAVEATLKAAELEGDKWLAYSNLASYYREMGQLERAVAEARRALELAPESERASLEAFIAQCEQRLASAESEEPALEEEGEPLPAGSDLEPMKRYLSQGAAYLEAGELDKAAEVYSQALTLDPDHIGAHSALGYIYYQQGRLEDAVKENLTVIRLEPMDYASHRNLAQLYQQMGELGKALAEAQLALSFASQDQKPHLQELVAQLEALQQKGPR